MSMWVYGNWRVYIYSSYMLTYPGQVTHMSVNYVIIDSDNGLSPVQQQAITRPNADLLRIGLLQNKLLWKIHQSILIEGNAYRRCLQNGRPFQSKMTLPSWNIENHDSKSKFVPA